MQCILVLQSINLHTKFAAHNCINSKNMIAASKFNQKMYCPSVVVDVFASACCDLDL